MDSVTFMSGRTYSVGDRVKVSTKYGTDGTGTVIGFVDKPSRTTVRIQMDPDTVYGQYDRWNLKTGGDFDRIRDHGVAGGEIV